MDYVYNYLFYVLWGLWVLYWNLAARDVKQTQRRESSRSRFTHSAFLIGGLVLFFWPRVHGNILFTRIWPYPEVSFWVGAVVLVLGAMLAIWARRVLGRNWSNEVTVKEDHELIQSGPYRWVRHPIYTSFLTGIAGSAIALDQWRGLLALVLVYISFRIKLSLEEKWMTEIFGPAYVEYRHRVGMLVPKFARAS